MNKNSFNKIEEDLFDSNFLNPHHAQSQPQLDDDAFYLFEEDDVSHASSDAEQQQHSLPASGALLPHQSNPNFLKPGDFPQIPISPDPHISSQFYTFTKQFHALMIQTLIEGRLATSDKIKAATLPSVLSSWRSVWKDRNEGTAYLTAWKRIQDKLTVLQVSPTQASALNLAGDHLDSNLLCFKNNLNQFVSHVDQWQDIVMSFHSDADFKHLGLRETVDRIKQVWTVGAKFYGIPESYVRTCVDACRICADEMSGCAPRSKRRRFEYTESIDVPAKEVAAKLQQLAVKHKVVLCIRQKYIRYKPFMAEVKDYACHRAGMPATAKKIRSLKREPYMSKRCGCGFRIRAIVPITNYNDKDKTFVYEEEGTAVFKLYAVHSGHEPGPLDGNARIMHRVVGHKGGFIDSEVLYGVTSEEENGENLEFWGKESSGDLHHTVLQQVNDLKNELGLLEGRIGRTPPENLGSVSSELFDLLNKVKSIAGDGPKSLLLSSEKHQHLDDMLVVQHDLPDWGDGKDAEMIEDDEDSFGRTLGEVASWDQMRVGESCKEVKWLKFGGEFAEKLTTKALRHVPHVDAIDQDLIGLTGIHVVDGFYHENPKWFDSPCGLNPEVDCGDGGCRNGEIA